jgi:phosphotransferase system HPr (HPr) family protein
MSANSETVSSERIVTLPVHLHARPAGRIAKAAARYDATVEVVAGDRRANARSVLAVMALGALSGSEVRVVAAGPDAVAAADEMAAILSTPESA